MRAAADQDGRGEVVTIEPAALIARRAVSAIRGYIAWQTSTGMRALMTMVPLAVVTGTEVAVTSADRRLF